MNNLDWLQMWYLSNCDGTWEHQYGIKISTLDNPGWAVEIDLVGVERAPQGPLEQDSDLGSNDWISCKLAAGSFRGHGDPLKLDAIIGVFRHWCGDPH
jgi:hypothetical protein